MWQHNNGDYTAIFIKNKQIIEYYLHQWVPVLTVSISPKNINEVSQ